VRLSIEAYPASYFHVHSASSYYNPLQWIQEKFAPKPRKADPLEEKRARDGQEKQGQQSVFEAAVSQEKVPKKASVESTRPVVVKKTATEVCPTPPHSPHASTDHMCRIAQILYG
jgi:large subunit ribosomal protein L22